MAANLIIIAVVLAAGIFALRSVVRKARSGGSCCSSGGSRLIPEEDKILDGNVIGSRTLHIEGMTCENCVNRVKRAINTVDGASARVDLTKGTAVVEYDREIDESILTAAVQRVGYRVVSAE